MEIKRIVWWIYYTSNTSNNSLAPELNHINPKQAVKFDQNCLKQDILTFTNTKVVNICIVCEINLWWNTQDTDIVLGNTLLGTVKFVKNTGSEKYKYSGYGTGFDAHGIYCYQMVVGLVKMWHWVLIWVYQSILINIFWFLVKVQQTVWMILCWLQKKNIL